MSRDRNVDAVRMELKYCEHCGGLWIREGGAGVYCGRCEQKVAELATAKKRPSRLMLPRQEKTVVEEYGRLIDQESSDLEAAVGGVA
jgi:ribosomal protein L37AE/L43A